MAAVSHDSPCGASLTRNTTTAVGKSSTADGAYLGSFGALSLADTRTALVAHAHPRRLQSCSTPPRSPLPPGLGGHSDGVRADRAQMVCTWIVRADCARTGPARAQPRRWRRTAPPRPWKARPGLRARAPAATAGPGSRQKRLRLKRLRKSAGSTAAKTERGGAGRRRPAAIRMATGGGWPSTRPVPPRRVRTAVFAGRSIDPLSSASRCAGRAARPADRRTRVSLQLQ